uniref:succinate dehydrogenase subunit 3 n=1 Tax=Dasysiphonia japonica TaxID=2506492 RepID=UPI002E79C7BE|nr:succinate dehydrogenase subunit 3 [Dasysiphonia japonica]WQF69523.1 succinate dehydrogenase subunit 3 [Dasysiphonia japonica]
MFNKTYIFYNRPVSPHLSIYLPQWSSILSIFHRITGFILVLLLFIFIILNEFFGNFYYFNIFLLNKFVFIFLIKFSYLIINWSLLYHFFNGFRYILTNLGYNLWNLTYFGMFLFMFFFIQVIKLIILCF